MESKEKEEQDIDKEEVEEARGYFGTQIRVKHVKRKIGVVKCSQPFSTSLLINII